VNILLVNWQDGANPHAGGAEIHLQEIFSRIARQGHRVRLVCSGWKGAAARATLGGIEVERHGNRHSFTLLGRGAVRRALAADPPDVVIEDINKLPLFLAGMTTAPFGVIIPHLFGSTAFQEASLPVASLVWLAERPIPRAYRRASFHAISDSTRDDLITRGVSPQRITVIYPGVDLELFTPGPAGSNRTATPTFLYIGRLRRYKGVETAIRALGIAHRARPDLRLQIAGTGIDRPRLEGVVRTLGLSDAVQFLGFVSEEQKVELLRRSWANLFPSAKEGWGITNVEAAACGTPSLASDSPGLRDSVRPGQTGFLVPHGDPSALATRMLELANDRELTDRLGRAARGFAEGLSWDQAAAGTEQWIRGMLRP
jgi:glycosyltransferase involved in cell wall biosynthesis